MDETITYVGLDVHRETMRWRLPMAVSAVTCARFGQIENTPTALARMLTKLSQPGER